MSLRCKTLLAACSLFSGLADAGTTVSPQPTEVQIKTVLDPSPFVSARAAGMGEALSTLADGIHAPYYNPAGIGGLHIEKTKMPFLRQLHFPYLGVGANENAVGLTQQYNAKGGNSDRAVGKAIVDANAGKRQYFRGSGLFSMVLGRFMLLQATDMQLAAFRNSKITSPTNNISTAYRNQTTTGMGFSLTDPYERVYLGVFTSLVSRSVIAGDIAYSQLVTVKDRTAVLSKGANTYSGTPVNVGAIFVLGKYARPALAVVARNLSNTHYTLTSGKATALLPKKMTENEDLTIGFSLSPYSGKTGAWNFIIEAQSLTDKTIAVDKKFRTALEWNVLGFGSRALLGLRAGYNLAGVSGGANLNLGLVQFEIASQAADIGIENRHFVERRNYVICSVNVLDEY